MKPIILVLASAVSILSSSAMAQVAPSGDTLTLTPAEKAQLLDRNTEDSVDAARAGIAGDGGSRDRAIHGEMGVMVGTNGTRGAYGTAAIPLGDNAGAVVSFESSRYGGYRR